MEQETPPVLSPEGKGVWGEHKNPHTSSRVSPRKLWEGNLICTFVSPVSPTEECRQEGKLRALPQPRAVHLFCCFLLFCEAAALSWDRPCTPAVRPHLFFPAVLGVDVPGRYASKYCPNLLCVWLSWKPKCWTIYLAPLIHHHQIAGSGKRHFFRWI